MAKRVEFTPEEQERLQRDLAKQLGPEFLNQRAGPGGKFTYIEGQAAIQLANELFGFNGWKSEMKNFTVDFLDDHDGKISVGVSAHIRVTLKDGTYHEDVGYGSMENSRSKAAAMEKAKKEAVTDALKRTLRMFGNLLGNCVYDKNYTKNMQYMKTPTIPFDPKCLYRGRRYKPLQQGSSSTATPAKPQHQGSPSKTTLMKAQQHGGFSSGATLVNTAQTPADVGFLLPDIESQELNF